MLHKISHMEPNISKYVKICEFVVSLKQIIWAKLFQNNCMLHFYAGFFAVFWGFTKIYLNDVEIWFFFL